MLFFPVLYLPQMSPLDSKDWHLVPNGLEPNLWCRTTYLSMLYDFDTSYAAPFVTAGCMGQAQWATGVGKESYLRLKAGVLNRTSSNMVGQLELANVPIEAWIIDPHVHDLLAGHCNAVCLPTHYKDVFHPGVMTCGVGMIIDRVRGLETFLEPLPRGPCRFPCVVLLTLQPFTVVHVDYSGFLYNIFPILGGHQEVCNGAASLEVELTTILPFIFLKLSLKPLV